MENDQRFEEAEGTAFDDTRWETGDGTDGPSPAVQGGTLGPYEILQEIGRGGMGVVYKAFHPGLKRTVALKVLIAGEDASEEAIARFHREAESVAKLGHHPGIVPVYDIGQDGRNHYFAMHFVKGSSLEGLIDTETIAPRQAARIAAKTARALQHAHERGVLHRDVKPANILLAFPDGQRIEGEPGTADQGDAMQDRKPLLTDFGLARDLGGDSRMTRSGVVLGTPHYMPPEQADGRLADLDGRSDVFSLGATLYEMLTLRPPFEGETIAEVIHQVVFQDPPSPRRANPAVHRDLETICMKCLEKSPARRYADAASLADDLERFLDGSPISARPPSAAGRVVRSALRHRWVTVTVAVSLLLIAGLVTTGTALLLQGEREKTKIKSSEAEARAEAQEATQTLEKSRAVASVFQGATIDLHKAHQALQGGALSGGRTSAPPAVVKESLVAVETWGAGLPDDSATQAAFLALKGWFVILSGDRTGGIDLLHEATETDEDVPFGRLFEAMFRLWCYLELVPIPSSRVQAGQVVFDPLPPESAEMMALREQAMALLEEAAKAPVWGKSSSADLQDILEGLAELYEGHSETAESRLTRALAVPELALLESQLLYCRAKLRHMDMRFDDAISDLEGVRRKAPHSSMACTLMAMAFLGKSQVEQVRGSQKRETLDRAIDACDRAVEADPGFARGYLYRADARLLYAHQLELAGESTGPVIERALKDADAYLAMKPSSLFGFHMRGKARVRMGEVQSRSGLDPEAMLSLGMDDLEKALAEPTLAANVHAEMGDACRGMGVWRFSQSRDGEARFQRAVREYGEAITLRPGDPILFSRRGSVLLSYGTTLRTVGRDGVDILRRAVADFDKTLSLYERQPEVYRLRGLARWRLFQSLPDSHDAKLDIITGAVSDQEKALEVDPDDFRAQVALATSLIDMGRALIRRGNPGTSCFSRAEKLVDKGLSQQPESWEMTYVKGYLLESTHRYAEAVKFYEHTLTLPDVERPMLEAQLAKVRPLAQTPAWVKTFDQAYRAVQARDLSKARDLYRKGLVRIEEEGVKPSDFMGVRADSPMAKALATLRIGHYNLCCLLCIKHARTADPVMRHALLDEAVGVLRKLLPFGFHRMDHLRRDPDLGPLRGRQDFQALMAEFERAAGIR